MVQVKRIGCPPEAGAFASSFGDDQKDEGHDTWMEQESPARAQPEWSSGRNSRTQVADGRALPESAPFVGRAPGSSAPQRPCRPEKRRWARAALKASTRETAPPPPGGTRAGRLRVVQPQQKRDDHRRLAPQRSIINRTWDRIAGSACRRSAHHRRLRLRAGARWRSAPPSDITRRRLPCGPLQVAP